MMWPRLRLLSELLSEAGLIWISIDDVEVHRLRAALDEILGGENQIAKSIVSKTSPHRNNFGQNRSNTPHVTVEGNISGPNPSLRRPWTDNRASDSIRTGMATKKAELKVSEPTYTGSEAAELHTEQ